MRLWRRRSGVWWRGCRVVPPQKYISFCSQNDKFRRLLLQFLTGRKHGSLGTRILQFNREITKLTKTVKIIQKFTVRPRGGGRSHHRPPVYATGLNIASYFLQHTVAQMPNHSSYFNTKYICEIPTSYSLSVRWIQMGILISRFSTNIWLYVGNDTR